MRLYEMLGLVWFSCARYVYSYVDRVNVLCSYLVQ